MCCCYRHKSSVLFGESSVREDNGMARLIVVAGASGAGKTFMLTQLANYRDDIIAIKKYTTREARKGEPDEESIDLKLKQDISNVRKCKYTYHYCGNYYGIKKEDIDSVLKRNKNPIVIVANCNTIDRIKQDYRDALILYVNTALSGDDLKKQLLKYRDPVDVEERMKRQKNGFIDYIQHMNKHLFDNFLVNYYDETFLQQIEFVLEEELNNSSDANYIFVIMSFDKKYDEIYEALKIAGKLVPNRELVIERVSDPLGDYIITERIEQSIKRAELIICDVSEKSLNVYYELGYARAMNKTIIVTAKTGTELPFDIRQHRTNFYNNPIELQRLVCNELNSYYQ